MIKLPPPPPRSFKNSQVITTCANSISGDLKGRLESKKDELIRAYDRYKELACNQDLYLCRNDETIDTI